MQRSLSILMAGIILFTTTACAGRGAMPIQINRPDDVRMSCTEIRAEILSNQTRITSYQIEKDDVTTYNITMGILGLFLLVPWFFVDLRTSAAASREEASIRQRNARLQQIAYEIPDCRI